MFTWGQACYCCCTWVWQGEGGGAGGDFSGSFWQTREDVGESFWGRGRESCLAKLCSSSHLLHIVNGTLSLWKLSDWLLERAWKPIFNGHLDNCWKLLNFSQSFHKYFFLAWGILVKYIKYFPRSLLSCISQMLMRMMTFLDKWQNQSFALGRIASRQPFYHCAKWLIDPLHRNITKV